MNQKIWGHRLKTSPEKMMHLKAFIIPKDQDIIRVDLLAISVISHTHQADNQWVVVELLEHLTVITLLSNLKKCCNRKQLLTTTSHTKNTFKTCHKTTLREKDLHNKKSALILMNPHKINKLKWKSTRWSSIGFEVKVIHVKEAIEVEAVAEATQHQTKELSIMVVVATLAKEIAQDLLVTVFESERYQQALKERLTWI